MTVKTTLWIAGGTIVLLIIAVLSIALIIQSTRLDKAKAEADKQANDQEKIRIETQYIPAALDKKTTTEKSHMGSVMWGDE